MPNTGTVRVHGLRELNRAFNAVSKDAKKGLRLEMVGAAEEVRAGAQGRAEREIRNIGERWSRMRTGATTKVVYVAPASRRRTGTPRPNLAGLLMDRAMQPALDDAQPNLKRAVETMLDRIGDLHGF